MVPPSVFPTANPSIALSPVPPQSSEREWAAVLVSDLSSLQRKTRNRALPASSVTSQLSITALHIIHSMVVSAELKCFPCPLSPFPQGRKYFFLPPCWMESLLLMYKMKCHFHKPSFLQQEISLCLKTLLSWTVIYLWVFTGFMFPVFFFQIVIPNCRYFTALLCFPYITAEIISEQTVSFSLVVIGGKKVTQLSKHECVFETKPLLSDHASSWPQHVTQ